MLTPSALVDWMEDSVKTLAIEKVNTIDQKIGYPTRSPNIMDPSSLRAFYSGFNVTDDYFTNSFSSAKFDTQKSWATLGKPVDHGLWGMSAPTVVSIPKLHLTLGAQYMLLPSPYVFPKPLPSFI